MSIEISIKLFTKLYHFDKFWKQMNFDFKNQYDFEKTLSKACKMVI
jgi:hypothetical protein